MSDEQRQPSAEAGEEPQWPSWGGGAVQGAREHSARQQNSEDEGASEPDDANERAGWIGGRVSPAREDHLRRLQYVLATVTQQPGNGRTAAGIERDAAGACAARGSSIFPSVFSVLCPPRALARSCRAAKSCSDWH